jgi:putative endonuclease
MDPFNFYIYIVTNPTKTVLHIGVTNDLPQRLTEHYLNRKSTKTFAGKYNCYNLIYSENFEWIEDAIKREKVLKGWLRKKKEALIDTKNPEWKFLNSEIMDWPPSDDAVTRGI